LKTVKMASSTVHRSEHGKLTFPFTAQNTQIGSIPRIGFGTGTLLGDECVASVRSAIRAGYRMIDTSLLYNNQESVGQAIREAIAAGEVTREELFITTKVAFFPADAKLGNNAFAGIFGRFHSENVKGFDSTSAAVQLCLDKLGLSYVDLVLIHNPATNLTEFDAAGVGHFFELAGNTPRVFSEEERALIMKHRLAKVKIDRQKAEAARAATWKALEDARQSGKAKFIGVSNYCCELVTAMKRYATVLPCVNQMEMHPRYASPEMRALAKDMGFVITAYGSGNSVKVEQNATVKEIAKRNGMTPTGVVLRWTLQKGAVVIPRSGSVEHIVENITAAEPSKVLDSKDMATLDAMDEAYTYYWSPKPNKAWAKL